MFELHSREMVFKPGNGITIFQGREAQGKLVIGFSCKFLTLFLIINCALKRDSKIIKSRYVFLLINDNYPPNNIPFKSL